MKKLVILFFMLPVFSLGQEISFNFEDQDLAKWHQSFSEHWTITSEHPIEGNFSLAHTYDSEESGTDWIALFHLALDVSASYTVWQFSLRYDFNPSSNNYWAVMLGTDCLPDDKLGVTDALILGVNYDGTDDLMKLWGVGNGEIHTFLNTGFNWEKHITKKEIVDFRITLSADHEISIEIDTAENGFVLLGRGELIWPNMINNFGILYKYTSTYDRGLSIDNITISGELQEDNKSPVVEGVLISNPHQIKIYFSEMVEISPESSWCVEGIGCSSVFGSIAKSIQLSLPEGLTPGIHYTLLLENLFDLNGNKLSEMIGQTFYYPAPYDVVINEIMADPSPSVLLPAAEYIELNNRSHEILSIEEWQLAINGRSYRLSPYTVKPGEYLIVCDSEDAALFETEVRVLPIKSMGAINNNEGEIILQDASGKLIHAVQYSNNWFADAEKKEGGWSLEMIDPESPCEMLDNWAESIDYRGGTPGEQNSVYSPGSKQLEPELWRVAVTDTGSLMLYFSEPLDSLRSSDPSFYSVDHAIGSPVNLILSWPVSDKMELFFDEDFKEGKEYRLSITHDPCDCSRNPFTGYNNNVFRVSQECDSADVIINEIMFEPRDGCREYIELYNRSGKTIEVKDWLLQVGDNSSRTLTQDYFPLLPGAYAIIAADIKGINDQARFSEAQKIIEMPDLPLLSNEGTLIQILNKEGNIIDQAFYDPAWHHELNTDTQGKSLERISSTGSGVDAKNWQSASSTAGCQTPGTINSQAGHAENSIQLTVDPKTITPNADGVDDKLNICYQLDESNYMARVMVYDLNGRLRKTIANGSVPGTEGCYYFDGKGENGAILPTDYYVLFFEAYNKSGKRFREKVSFVIVMEY